MELRTSRLILREFRPDDFDGLAQLMADPDFMRFSTGTFSREKTAAFLDKVVGWQDQGLPSQFAMILPETGALLGYCGFFHHEVDGVEEIEIGYRLKADYWNQGLATEGARAVRDHGFRDWKLARVISLIHVENTRSRRVAEKNGMVMEKETTFKGFPIQVFTINRAQWQALGGV
jgi:RimJ/RimL family protein N-acetyltransferase